MNRPYIIHFGRRLEEVVIDANTSVYLSPEKITPDSAKEWREKMERSRKLAMGIYIKEQKEE